MSLVDKNNMISKSISLDNRVIQKRTSADKICFANADIQLSFTVNTTDRNTAGDLILTFDKTLDYIIGSYQIGNNSKLFKRVNSTNSITKNVNINLDNNGPGNGIVFETFLNNRFHLSKIDDITTLTVSRTGAGIQSMELNILSAFPSLVTYVSNISQTPNFAFLENIPQISNLNFQLGTGVWSNLESLATSNLKSLILKGYNSYTPNIFANLPDSLYYLSITQMTSLTVDLADFFKQNKYRIGIFLNNINRVIYTGGAFFPQLISDTPDSKIDYLICQSSSVIYKLSSDQAAQLLIDFANQVDNVILQTPNNKRIRISGTTEPINFPGYVAARTKITDVLGISLSFS
ncbi:hypothetical protein SAMN05421825_2305 [Epilithonimonas hungarica]|uniref:Uncharacterized protein n=2 Tax=Epilithonimonas hungarica TaxID=454006 RepID=A0A1G7PKV6_9FLAO|nr:hypothetical protein SAMN05421825_2305 [Epilithonimonas hungarica]